MKIEKKKLDAVLERLSEDKTEIVFKFAEWLSEDDELTSKEVDLLRKAENQIKRGEYVEWRKIKRTKI
jgi:hypothetical protein